MCGITGIVNFDLEPVSPVQLKAMTDALIHRGPDGEGQYMKGSCRIRTSSFSDY